MMKEQKAVTATAKGVVKCTGKKEQPKSWAPAGESAWVSTSNAVVRDECIDYFRAREELWKKFQERSNCWSEHS